MNDKPKHDFEFAPNEKLKFVSRIENKFILKVLEMDPSEVILTDESHITDFTPLNDIESAVERLASGKCKFILNYHRLAGEVKTKQWWEYPIHFKNDVLRRTEDVFVVDIYDVYESYMPEIFYKILKEMPVDKRVAFQEEE